MSRNGSGTYSLPSGNPVVTGTVISSTTTNNTLSDIATALTGSVASDGQTPMTGPLAMGASKITGLAAGTARTDAANMGNIQDGTAEYITVSGTDTLLGTQTNPTLAAYVAGQLVKFIAVATNTGAVTLNINSLGAKAVTKSGSTALDAGDILNTGVYEAIYDGTRFQLVNPIGVTLPSTGATKSGIQSQSYTFFTTGGTATAFTLTPSPASTGNSTGQQFKIRFNAAAGASPTLAVSGQTAKNLKYYDTTGTKQAITDAQVPNAWIADVQYDGTDWVVLDPVPIGYLQATDVASASTTVLPTTIGDYLHVTGVTTITAITLAQGIEKTVVFDGALTLTNGASLILPGGANITTAAGDCAVFRGEAAGVVRCVNYAYKTPSVPIGVGQTWSNPARSSGVTYTNSGSKPIQVMVQANATTGFSVVVDGVTLQSGSYTYVWSCSFIVPPGLTYVVTAGTGIYNWAELS